VGPIEAIMAAAFRTSFAKAVLADFGFTADAGAPVAGAFRMCRSKVVLQHTCIGHISNRIYKMQH
jgi:hypothetical protein